MSKIRVLSDQVANQIAAGEVVERPMSVAKELVENAIDAGARRIQVDVEAGGRRLLRVADDGEGMTRDDALLAFERHATSKISSSADLFQIATLGFRGEALASIASVARVELLSFVADEASATRVLIEGGRMRDVSPAARTRGTTIIVRDLFFNVPARRKFLRSEATESFHLTNLVTHYALAHPEIAFALTNNGREVLRASPAANLRERAYQIFGAEFLTNLLELPQGAHPAVAGGAARVSGFVSAPRERRTSRDAQFMFVNGRYVRDRLIARSLIEAYRGLLPPNTYPVALLFLDVPRDEVDVNVHPAKIEVRFRRSMAVGDAVRETVRAALKGGAWTPDADSRSSSPIDFAAPSAGGTTAAIDGESAGAFSPRPFEMRGEELPQAVIDYAPTDAPPIEDWRAEPPPIVRTAVADSPGKRPEFDDRTMTPGGDLPAAVPPVPPAAAPERDARSSFAAPPSPSLPPYVSAFGLVREIEVDSLSSNIRPLGQLEESYIIATDEEGLLLIDQHLAHERVLFEKYRADEEGRGAGAQQLLMPETFDLTPAQTAAFALISADLESYGFDIMRLSGRTVAVKAVPADLPPGAARNLLAELLESVEAERRGAASDAVREKIAARLACRAAVGAHTALSQEKMRWLIDRLLRTAPAAIGLHGRPIILRLTTRDIEKGFQRS